MKKEYFVLTCFNGDPIVESYTKEKLLEDLNEDAWGPSINILDKLPENGDMNYWGESILIIKGNIVTPNAVTTITKFEIE
jgi:hypothetical protein